MLQLGFWRDCGINSPSMAAVNRHRKEPEFLGTMSNDDLEEGHGDFTIHCHDLMAGDNASIIDKFELLKQAVFIDTYKNCDDSDDCEE